MRLGQLARKLAVTPAEIIEFLVANQVQAEEGVNSKLEKEQVALVMQRFAPATALENILTDTVVQEEPAVVSELPPAEEINVAEHTPVVSEEKEIVTSTETPAEAEQPAEEKNGQKESYAEVIKAPKVELAGLKVLGKIELPTRKKAAPPEETTSAAADPSATSSPAAESTGSTGARSERRSKNDPKDPRGRNRKNDHRDRKDQRPRKNPVALQREREAQEAEKKRKAEAERKKERQTQYYLKKVKTSGPTKAARIYQEEVIEMSDDLRPTPKTWLGKLLRWFKS